MTDARTEARTDARAEAHTHDVLIGHDPSVWVALPSGWPFHEHTAAPSWVDATLDDIRTRSSTVTRSGLKHLRRVLEHLAQIPRDDESHYLFAPSVDELAGPLRVQYAFCDGEREAMLRRLVLESDLDQIEPPLLEPFSTPDLGVGWRGVRFAEYEGELEVAVVYSFRAEPYDIRVSLHVGPPDETSALLPFGDDFVHGISVVPAE
jgi:hypothetical protein